MADCDYAESYGWFLSRGKANASHVVYLTPDDSWYSGPALSFGIRSKDLTVQEWRQFNVLRKKLPENIEIFGFGQTEDLGWLALRCCPLDSVQLQSYKCHQNLKFTQTEMSLKLKCHPNWNNTKTAMSPKLKCHQNWNITMKKMLQNWNVTKS